MIIICPLKGNRGVCEELGSCMAAVNVNSIAYSSRGMHDPVKEPQCFTLKQQIGVRKGGFLSYGPQCKLGHELSSCLGSGPVGATKLQQRPPYGATVCGRVITHNAPVMQRAKQRSDKTLPTRCLTFNKQQIKFHDRFIEW